MTVKDDHCEKNDNYSVMNTLLDIDKARRCSALNILVRQSRQSSVV